MRYFCCLALSWIAVFLIGIADGERRNAPDASQFTVLGVTVGQDNLETLSAKLGPVKKCHTSHHVEIVSYRNTNEELVFEFGEVGGGDVTGFHLRSIGRAAHCPATQN